MSRKMSFIFQRKILCDKIVWLKNRLGDKSFEYTYTGKYNQGFYREKSV